MDHNRRPLKRSTMQVERSMNGPAYPPLPRVRRHSEQTVAQPPALHSVYPVDRASTLRPSKAKPTYAESPIAPKSWGPRRRDRPHHDLRVAFHPHWRADDSGTSDGGTDSDAGYFDPHAGGARVSPDSRRKQLDPRSYHRHEWPALDPHSPAASARESPVYFGHHRPPPPAQPRRRSTSLLKCLAQGGMAMFDINPRWAKRRPLL